MIISISGTPGTGKTKVAKILSKKMDANLIIINDLVKKKKLKYDYDKKRKTKIIDIKQLQRAVLREIVPGINIVEGHLAHFIVSDYVFVLRAAPNVLQTRLKRRKWPKTKVTENIQSEILDIITAEAIWIHSHDKVFQIDTSKKNVSDIVKQIMRTLKKPGKTGCIDWTKKYSNWLTNS